MRLIAALAIFLAIECQAYTPNPQVEPSIWESLEPYFLPEYHPIKGVLDKIFQKRRATADLKALKKGHFKIIDEGEFTNCVVCKHKKAPGYIFKIYLDSGPSVSAWEKWLERIEGAESVRGAIERHGYQELFKVPMKWIYPLPLTPLPTDKYHAQYFILVAEDMNLCKESRSLKKWKSSEIYPDLLDALWVILNEEGMCDCVYAFNLPFSEDGKIAFIDTESHHCWPVRMDRLAPFLGKEMREYWKHLLRTK